MDTQPKNNAKKILLVDDDRFLLDMYAIKFSKSGYEVQTSDNTENAFKIVKDGWIPDIILCDLVMPGMDGLELISKLQAENLCPDAKLIMLTNQGSSDDIGRAKKLNVDGYIVKATTVPSEVLKEVESILVSPKKI
jgi:CheY-like chemotaxis protein